MSVEIICETSYFFDSFPIVWIFLHALAFISCIIRKQAFYFKINLEIGKKLIKIQVQLFKNQIITSKNDTEKDNPN